MVFAISRAARNTVALLRFAELCAAKGVQFESVSEPIGGTYGKVFLALLGSIAELESQMKSDRAVLKRRQMVADDLWTGGPRPFGLDVVYADDEDAKTRDARLVISAGEAELIRTAAQDILRGQSLGAIMRRWNDAGIQTTLGHAWRRTSIRQLFLRPSLAEKPAIISKRDAEALRAMLEDPASHHPRKIARYTLTGKLVCSKCGGKMQGYPGRGRRYICRSDGHVHRTIQAEPLEDFVINTVTARAEDVQLATVGDPAGVQGPILAELDAIDAKLATFAENAALAGMPVSAIRSGTKALIAERERLEAKLEAAAPPQPPASYVEARPGVMAEVRAEIEALVQHIVIHPPVLPANVFQPARIEIIWR